MLNQLVNRIENKLQLRKINQVVNKTDSLVGKISAGGFPEEALDIKKALNEIRKKLETSQKREPEKKYRPKTVEEAVNLFISNMNDEGKEEARKMSLEHIGSLHFSTGMWIRNNYGLWDHNDDLLRDCLRVQKETNPETYKKNQEFYRINPISTEWPMHPDDASMVILEAIWRKLSDS